MNVYAPDLHTAFDLARREYGSATLTCLGSTADPNGGPWRTYRIERAAR